MQFVTTMRRVIERAQCCDWCHSRKVYRKLYMRTPKLHTRYRINAFNIYINKNMFTKRTNNFLPKPYTLHTLAQTAKTFRGEIQFVAFNFSGEKIKPVTLCLFVTFEWIIVSLELQFIVMLLYEWYIEMILFGYLKCQVRHETCR